MIGIGLKLHVARSTFRPDGNNFLLGLFCFALSSCFRIIFKWYSPDTAVVVLVVEVLDPLEVERLDDPLEAEVQLGAASRGHHGGPIEAVDLYRVGVDMDDDLDDEI